MEGAFNHVGNHLVSDSAAAINAGADDLSGLGPSDSLFYSKAPGTSPTGENRLEPYDDDDKDSVSTPVDPITGLKINGQEEEKQLPEHACAWVPRMPLLI
jgi:regulator of nonsense transcripts 1